MSHLYGGRFEGPRKKEPNTSSLRHREAASFQAPMVDGNPGWAGPH